MSADISQQKKWNPDRADRGGITFSNLGQKITVDLGCIPSKNVNTMAQLRHFHGKKTNNLAQLRHFHGKKQTIFYA